MNAKLTPKQQRFIDEYMIDLNATQAAMRAGYSSRTARQIGAENLLKPVVAAAIATIGVVVTRLWTPQKRTAIEALAQGNVEHCCHLRLLGGRSCGDDLAVVQLR